jgi:hypothetical protein
MRHFNRKFPNVGFGERLAAAAAAMQHSVSVFECEGHQP